MFRWLAKTGLAALALALLQSPPLASAQTAALAGPAAAYPNPAMTVGSVDPNVTQGNIQQTICVSGYTATVRPPTSYTEPLKIQQIAAYGYADTNVADYEEDHFIPLEIGGNPTDPANLWPEPYAEPYGARTTDKVENYLHEQVCSGAMALADAQAAVQTDWVAVSQQIAPAALPSPAAATVASPSVAPVVPQPAPAGVSGHTYYASTFHTAHNIYCDNDPEWRSLSPRYLANYPSLPAAQTALPGYVLHRPC